MGTLRPADWKSERAAIRFWHLWRRKNPVQAGSSRQCRDSARGTKPPGQFSVDERQSGSAQALSFGRDRLPELFPAERTHLGFSERIRRYNIRLRNRLAAVFFGRLATPGGVWRQ